MTPSPLPPLHTAGIVLAAGASSRMGRPKALLKTPANHHLATHQAHLLRTAGCTPVAVVIGAQAHLLRETLPTPLPLIENPHWAQGRATSVQAGAAAFPDADGWLFLPIDAIGIRPLTLRALLAAAAWNPRVPWRPLHGDQRGNLLWIPRHLGPALAALPPDARLDEWIAPQAQSLSVDDPNLLRNVNTPDDFSHLPPSAFTL